MPASLSPMMQQYLDLKEQYKDCLLFFRLGDFYEMFFEDAQTASRELELVLTGRDCGLEERAPMCGVPYHSVDGYIEKLISKGYKVAICEQLTDPAKSKGLVERDVIRIVTPGTVIEESMLDEKKNNYLMSVFLQDKAIGLAAVDVSTGDFSVCEINGSDFSSKFLDELGRIQPTEIISNEGLFLQEDIIRQIQSRYFVNCYPGWAFDRDTAEKALLNQFGVATLECYGCEQMYHAISAAGALIAYLCETQKNALEHINKISVFRREDYMVLDGTTRRNLEITAPLRQNAKKRSTLLGLLDHTKTSMGGRLLRNWVGQPLQSISAINTRLDAVGELKDNIILREELRSKLDEIYDIERLCSRIAYGSVNARDCIALKTSLAMLPSVKRLLTGVKAGALNTIQEQLDTLEDITGFLEKSIADEPPLSVKEGGIIKQGYNAEVDKLRTASTGGREWIAKLEAQERSSTGIKNLRIGYNRVFGYYIEVTKSYQQLVPYHYQRKQTLAGAERYITPELKKLEDEILGADEKCIELEYTLFTEIREGLSKNIIRLQTSAAQIAALDAFQSLGTVASQNNYTKPNITENETIEILDGRHPVVEYSVKERFVPNNTLLDESQNRLLVITGPNMAGKSTYMRQVALIALMAHIGSFVPARKAIIPIIDRIFTRVGASDDLASGQSTFMVEMTELANILHNATRKSLLILDEIGRGTSTFDGLSIAWAVIEYVTSRSLIGAKTLFATHYHELSELEGRIEGIKNYRISVKEVGDDIIFLRKVVRGSADKSFGIQVARLAGIPDSVINRAKEILGDLESADINREVLASNEEKEPHQLQLMITTPDEILTILQKLEIDKITPMEALNTLYDLHLRSKALGSEEAFV